MRTSIQEATRVFPGISQGPEARFTFVVGRLLCSDVRDMLEDEVFAGRPIRWREGSGWIERTFTVVGEPAHVKQVAERIQSWAQANGLDK